MTIFDQIKADIDSAIKEELITPALVDRGYGWIEQMRVEFPIAHRILMAVIYGKPEAVLKALAVWEPSFKGLDKKPVAVRYVKLLQERLRSTA